MFPDAVKVALVAGSLALDVFAVSVGVGVRGVKRSAALRIGASFASAEVGMSLVGVALGAVAGRTIGDVAAYFGFTALVGVGAYMIYESSRESADDFDLSRGFGLFVASLSISLDSLGIGFSVVYIGVPLVVTLTAIAIASISSTMLGLRFGSFFGAAAGERAALVAGLVLIATGVLFGTLKYFHIG